MSFGMYANFILIRIDIVMNLMYYECEGGVIEARWQFGAETLCPTKERLP